MGWTAPKTNWAITYDNNGKSAGDFINKGDYNRIKNNIAYIQTFAEKIVYDKYPDMGADKAYLDYPRASEWNLIETALYQLAKNIGVAFPAKTFMENGFALDVTELNRIENMTLRLKTQYETAVASTYRLSFTLGRKRSVIKP